MKRQAPSIWTSDLGILALLLMMVVVGASSLLLSAHEPVDAAPAATMASGTVGPAPDMVTILPAVIEVVGTRDRKTARDTDTAREPSAGRRDAS